MIKFLKKLLILPLLVFSFYACSNNDSSSETNTAALEGKWQYTKTGTISNNQEILTNYQHTTGCTKDYIEILAGGILKSHEFNNPNCQEIISTGSWTRSNNAITISYPGQPNVNGEILELTTMSLKTKFTSVGTIDLELFTRIP